MLPCGGIEFNKWQVKNRGYSLTVDKPESLSSDSPVLFLEESLELVPCHVDVLDSEKIIYPFDCTALSMNNILAGKDPRKRRFLSFPVTRASVEISSTINFTTITLTAGIE